MSSFLSFGPLQLWTKKEADRTTTRGAAAAATVLESLDLGGGGDDAELVALLTEIAATGKVVTEDVVVDCQLTQFPVYGTATTTTTATATTLANHTSSTSSITGAAVMDNDKDYEEDEEDQPRHNHPPHQQQQQHLPAGEATSTSWLPWGVLGAVVGGGGGGATTTTQQLPISEDDDDDDLMNIPTPTRTSSRLNAATANAAANNNNALDDADWDWDEQQLWKTTTTTTELKTTAQLLLDLHKKSSRTTIYRQPLIVATTTNVSINNNSNNSINKKVESSPQMVNEQTDAKPEHQLSFLSSPRANAKSLMTTSTTATTASPLRVHKEPKQQQQQHPLPVDRQHWMPDQLCKQCYACEIPFTVFRRRHHCRLCGQVFCNTCSAHFVPTTTTASTPPPPSTTTTTTSTSSSNINGTTEQQQQEHQQQQTTVRVCQMCFDHASTTKSELFAATAAAQSNLATTTTTSGTISQVGSSNKKRGVQFDDDVDYDGGSVEVPLVLQMLVHSTKNTTASPLFHEQIRLLAADAVMNSSSNHHRNAAAGSSVIHTSTTTPYRNPPQSSSSSSSYTASKKIMTTTTTTTAGMGGGGGSAATAADGGGVVGTETAAASNTYGRSDSTNDNASQQTATAALLLLKEGQCHLGMTAAEHLEVMARELLRLHAPLIWNAAEEEKKHYSDQGERMISSWINTLLTLATRCCATVNPNVKKGDLLDIRPYVKVKVISGGSYRDCAYMSGVLFRKTVSHKRMAKEVMNPRIMLLSGGIEFTRTENRIASLETLFEQEDKYMEIMVGKILKLHPDVLLVGRSVSRKAQELLLKAGVILVQHVKQNLLSRISRQTGASIISSTDHVMNQFGLNVLGKCRRFRLVAFRDNEAWTDQEMDPTENANEKTSIVEQQQEAGASSIPKKAQLVSQQRSIGALLADPTLSNHERQAALAANRLGEGVLDGCEAVKAGLAKRGVAHMYIMLEGCPKHLGCTVVLRGASRAALKQVKVVFRFLANSAYNLLLETTFLKERGARLRPDFKVLPQHAYSSSLCVDYGKPPEGRKVRPWNGGNTDHSVPRLESGELSALDHQSILITSVWMTEKTQCCPAEVKGICYYSLQDVSLGQFLRDSCFNLSLKCQNPNCKKSVLDHSLSFVHNDGLINIMVEEMDEALKQSMSPKGEELDDALDEDDEASTDRPIATWTYCQYCCKVVTPLTYISDLTWKFSFGKFLEVIFYNRDAIVNAPGHGCSCNVQSAATLYFGCGKLAARFTYERVSPFGVFVRRTLPLDIAFHRREAIRRLDLISVESSNLFVNFDKHIEKISREARSLFNSAMNRPEHLQTVLSELNRIGSEVDHAAKILQEKIASVSDNCRRNNDASLNGALFRFPLFARRYLFNLTTAWNEKLSATGQAISAMKRIAASNSHDNTMGPNVTASIGDPLNEELSEGMKRLRQLIEHYARYNVTDITQVLPTLPGGSDIQQDGEFDDDFDDPESSIDFSDGIDADVLASRRRLKNSKQGQALLERQRTVTQRPTKTLGTRRTLADAPRISHDSTSLASAPPKPIPGGIVKPPLFSRLWNRGGREYDPYVVDLGIFAEGRPRLAPGVDGIVVPVIDEQLSTIIAYSLASTEYAKQFKHFSKEGAGFVLEGTEWRDRNRRPGPKPDLDAGVGDDDGIPGPTDIREKNRTPLASTSQSSPSASAIDENKGTERRMLNRNRSYIKHTFRDVDEKGQVTCKFVCTTYWATQFHAVRQSFLSGTAGKSDDAEGAYRASQDVEQSYVESLSSAYSWAASGGKSGASFARTADDRFVIKCISRTELQMFLDCAPAYFEYLSKAFFHGLPTVLCKIVGVYQIGVHNRETGKRSMEQVAVMQNIFYNKKITKIFDLKGSLRGRFAAQVKSSKEDGTRDTPTNGLDKLSGYERKSTDRWLDDSMSRSSANSLVEESTDNSKRRSQGAAESGPSTLLDGDFLEFTLGRPMPLTDRAKAVFQMSILNDTLFLSIINVLDYSILVGFDEEKMELVVGIIDFMRQYDILKQMERVGKSLPMVVGSEAPTIIQPPLYKARFTNAMERYFMTVPSKWTTI